MAARRVVITGVGVVAAPGNGREAFWSAVAAGRSGIVPLPEAAGWGLAFPKGAIVNDFCPEQVLPPNVCDLTDRFAQFALVAAHEAVADATLSREALAGRRGGVILGASIGGQSTQDTGFATLYREGKGRLHPTTIPKVMPNAGASQVAMAFGVTGPSYTVSAACSSSNFAIGQAFWMVRSGALDYALCGGSEAPFSFGYLKAWEALRVVSSDTCRPFSAQRNGMVLGEGGAVLLLEEAQRALERGATIYAELIGFGMSSDAYHLVIPSPAGAAAAVMAALADGEIEPAEVDYVNAHGSGTLANDAAETAAIHQAFGDHARRLAVSGTKSMHGHALGAAGAIEAVATVLAIKRQVIPPTAGYLGPDPDCDLDYVPNEARAGQIDVALSNGFAFGGMNAVLAFRRWSD